MGLRLKPKNETTCAFMNESQKLINLQNWRGIAEWKHEGVKGVFVIAMNFRVYFIPSYTMEMFHEASYCNKTLDIPFQYVKNVLSCQFCNGDGKTDWVEAARGPAPKKQIHGYQPDYQRSKRAPLNLVYRVSSDPPYYLSSVYTRQGEELCKKCFGSGLQLAVDWDIEKTIKLKHS